MAASFSHARLLRARPEARSSRRPDAQLSRVTDVRLSRGPEARVSRRSAAASSDMLLGEHEPDFSPVMHHYVSSPVTHHYNVSPMTRPTPNLTRSTRDDTPLAAGFAFGENMRSHFARGDPQSALNANDPSHRLVPLQNSPLPEALRERVSGLKWLSAVTDPSVNLSCLTKPKASTLLVVPEIETGSVLKSATTVDAARHTTPFPARQPLVPNVSRSGFAADKQRLSSFEAIQRQHPASVNVNGKPRNPQQGANTDSRKRVAAEHHQRVTKRHRQGFNAQTYPLVGSSSSQLYNYRNAPSNDLLATSESGAPLSIQHKVDRSTADLCDHRQAGRPEHLLPGLETAAQSSSASLQPLNNNAPAAKLSAQDHKAAGNRPVDNSSSHGGGVRSKEAPSASMPTERELLTLVLFRLEKNEQQQHAKDATMTSRLASLQDHAYETAAILEAFKAWERDQDSSTKDRALLQDCLQKQKISTEKFETLFSHLGDKQEQLLLEVKTANAMVQDAHRAAQGHESQMGTFQKALEENTARLLKDNESYQERLDQLESCIDRRMESAMHAPVQAVLDTFENSQKNFMQMVGELVADLRSVMEQHLDEFDIQKSEHNPRSVSDDGPLEAAVLEEETGSLQSAASVSISDLHSMETKLLEALASLEQRLSRDDSVVTAALEGLGKATATLENTKADNFRASLRAQKLTIFVLRQAQQNLLEETASLKRHNRDQEIVLEDVKQTKADLQQAYDMLLQGQKLSEAPKPVDLVEQQLLHQENGPKEAHDKPEIVIDSSSPLSDADEEELLALAKRFDAGLVAADGSWQVPLDPESSGGPTANVPESIASPRDAVERHGKPVAALIDGTSHSQDDSQGSWSGPNRGEDSRKLPQSNSSVRRTAAVKRTTTPDIKGLRYHEPSNRLVKPPRRSGKFEPTITQASQARPVGTSANPGVPDISMASQRKNAKPTRSILKSSTAANTLSNVTSASEHNSSRHWSQSMHMTRARSSGMTGHSAMDLAASRKPRTIQSQSKYAERFEETLHKRGR